MRGQLDLIGGLPFGETMPTAAVPEVQYTPAEPEPVPTRKKRRGIAPANSFEAWLSKRGVPYCAITARVEAALSMHAGKPFDYLVYREHGPNLLVLLEPHPSEADESRMQEWERTFGEGFAAAFVWYDGKEWIAVLVAEWRGNAAHARPLAWLL